MFRSNGRIAALCAAGSAKNESCRACCELVSRNIRRYGRTPTVRNVCIQQRASSQQNRRERASVSHESLSHKRAVVHSVYITLFWIFFITILHSISALKHLEKSLHFHTSSLKYIHFFQLSFFDKMARYFWTHTLHTLGTFPKHPQRRASHFSNDFLQENTVCVAARLRLEHHTSKNLPSDYTSTHTLAQN